MRKANMRIDLGELRKLRRISKQCADNKKTQEYVRDVCYKIRAMLIDYAHFTNIPKNKVLEKYLGHHASPKHYNTGQIPTRYVNEAIENGNMRERLMLIVNFCMSGRSVILWAVKNKKHKYIKSCYRCYRCYRCYHKRTSLPSRITAYNVPILRPPLRPPLRRPRVKKVRKYLINIKDVYPKISARELLYIREQEQEQGIVRGMVRGGAKYVIKNNILPWISGLQYWVVNEKNPYIKLMRHYKQMVVSGPSGNTDLILSILRLFDNFNIDLAIFACVSHLCNAPHHSPCEILLAAIPYREGGGNSESSESHECHDWTIEEDAFKYVKRKLKVYRK